MTWRALTAAVCLASVLISCQPSQQHAAEPTAEKPEAVAQYALEGTVVRLEESGRIATIKHGPIHDAKGALWMEAMTMEYPVPDEHDFAQLRRGQTIRATIHSRPSDYEHWLADVRPLDQRRR